METVKQQEQQRFKQKYSSSVDVSRHIAADIKSFGTGIGLDSVIIEQVELCLVELINNVYEHAYQSADGCPIEITSFIKDENEFVIEISDYGHAMATGEFDAAVNAEFIEPSLEDPETWTTSGRGLIIVVELTDNLEYKRQGEKNTIKFYKKAVV